MLPSTSYTFSVQTQFCVGLFISFYHDSTNSNDIGTNEIFTTIRDGMDESPPLEILCHGPPITAEEG